LTVIFCSFSKFQLRSSAIFLHLLRDSDTLY